MYTIIMTIITIGAILYNISKIICVTNVILYVIFMEKFNKNRKIPLYIFSIIIIYCLIMFLINEFEFENIYILALLYYVVFVINIIVNIKTIGVVKSNK